MNSESERARKLKLEERGCLWVGRALDNPHEGKGMNPTLPAVHPQKGWDMLPARGMNGEEEG
jgi:hypothetical protein